MFNQFAIQSNYFLFTNARDAHSGPLSSSWSSIWSESISDSSFGSTTTKWSSGSVFGGLVGDSDGRMCAFLAGGGLGLEEDRF